MIEARETVIANVFKFVDETEINIPVINSSSEIPKNMSVGDCFFLLEINKTICFEGIKKNVVAGEVLE